MWFKNIKLFQLADIFKIDDAMLEANLTTLAFRPCTQAMPQSIGWVSVIDKDNAPLIHAAMGRKMICLRIDEKILPTTVVRDQANERIKEIEAQEDRQLSKREKASVKDQIYFTLLQQAFCRSTKIYAYFDLKKNWLIVNCTNAKKLEIFTAHLKKVLTNIELISPETKNIPKLLTGWLLSKHYPDSFTIEKNAVLEDFNDIKRVIRVKNQDLFNDSIQNLIKEGCVPKQITLTWFDRITFNLQHDLALTSLKYDDAVIAASDDDSVENEAEQFDADFLIMTETLQTLLSELLQYLQNEKEGTVHSAELTQ